MALTLWSRTNRIRLFFCTFAATNNLTPNSLYVTVEEPLLSRSTNGTSPPIKISAVSPESIEIFGSAKILPFD